MDTNTKKAQHTPGPWKLETEERIMETINEKPNAAHTPEPWYVAEGRSGPSLRLDNHGIAGVMMVPASFANLSRAASCVNSCAGINPEAVPDLLAALEAVLPLAQAYYQTLPDDGPEQDHYINVIKAARAALAEAQGEERK
jgi:hypothetical protein